MTSIKNFPDDYQEIYTTVEMYINSHGFEGSAEHWYQIPGLQMRFYYHLFNLSIQSSHKFIYNKLDKYLSSRTQEEAKENSDFSNPIYNYMAKYLVYVALSNITSIPLSLILNRKGPLNFVVSVAIASYLINKNTSKKDIDSENVTTKKQISNLVADTIITAAIYSCTSLAIRKIMHPSIVIIALAAYATYKFKQTSHWSQNTTNKNDIEITYKKKLGDLCTKFTDGLRQARSYFCK